MSTSVVTALDTFIIAILASLTVLLPLATAMITSWLKLHTTASVHTEQINELKTAANDHSTQIQALMVKQNVSDQSGMIEGIPRIQTQ